MKQVGLTRLVASAFAVWLAGVMLAGVSWLYDLARWLDPGDWTP